jgi:hypothetical protein
MVKLRIIIFERVVNGRIHRFTKRAYCHSAFDIAYEIFLRAVNLKVKVDILDLMDQLKT